MEPLEVLRRLQGQHAPVGVTTTGHSHADRAARDSTGIDERRREPGVVRRSRP